MEIFTPLLTDPIPLPFFASTVEAGFPSPSADYVESALDLQRYLVRHPAATFLVRAKGESMRPDIESGDLLVVDRSLRVQHNQIVIAALNGDLTVKRLFQRGGVVSLIPSNPDYTPIDVTTGFDFEIWGVVAHVIRCTL